MTALVETYRGAVYPWHCDHMRHMNVMWYVGKFDEATWDLFRRLGLTPSELRRSGRGMAAVEQRIAYERELHEGDVVVVRSGVVEVRDKAVRFVHQMYNAETGALSAVTALTAVHLDTAARRAIPFPPSVAEAAKALAIAFEEPW